MTEVSLRELNSSVSKFARQAQAGERILITDRGHVIAELGPVSTHATTSASLTFAERLRSARDRFDGPTTMFTSTQLRAILDAMVDPYFDPHRVWDDRRRDGDR